MEIAVTTSKSREDLTSNACKALGTVSDFPTSDV